ncbi:hypothetical protein Sango_3079200 [Sesamum angolense]|uniref:Reverse transcriptase zinc-binding domain-containing protein n=1 Tax=Sesamum angolense TaxID=2727404 RepID=A0AAE1TA33_9LAMI|nr:hypothetical protein Sango_3079200 [Sesamum angolense]
MPGIEPGLDRFATLSGLNTNPQKSQLIISKAAAGLRDSLLATLGFQEGQLPVRYLGLPLISARLSIADCQPLLQKIYSRIKGWEGVQLSFAGRVQLIKSVLISFEVYWAMAFILPKGIIKEILKRLRTFLWKGNSASGYQKWLGRRYADQLRKTGSSRFDFGIVRFGQLRKIKELGVGGKCSHLYIILMSHIHYRVGDGDSISLWHDPWHPLGPLISRFPRGPQLTSTGLLDKLSVVIKDGQWNWPLITDIACLEITYMLPPILEGPDIISWKSKDGSFNTSTAYELFHPRGPKVGWSSLLMGSFKILKNCFILWLAIMGRLSTLDKPWLHHIGGSCILCRMEYLRHMITFSFHAPFPAVALPLSDSRSHFHGPTGISNMVFNGRLPDGVESMWLMQHFDLYWLQLSTTYGRNAMQGDSNSVIDHPRLWAGLLWRRLDRGSSVSL